MTPETIRAWWWHRQGLGAEPTKLTPAAVLERHGWLRSVGSCSPYLAMRARGGVSRAAADAAVAAGEIRELPSARGCTYVVPASEYALALRAGAGSFAAGQVAPAKKFCGVTDAELERLCDAVLAALGDGPRDPAELKAVLGGAVRNLGEAGKKRGVTTTLPLATGLLQSRGRVHRVPASGRLDQQRFSYARWTPDPLAGAAPPDDEVTLQLARSFFRQAGPATAAQFAWWSGASAKAAKAAVAAICRVSCIVGRQLRRWSRSSCMAESRESPVATRTTKHSPEPCRASYISTVPSPESLVLLLHAQHVRFHPPQ